MNKQASKADEAILAKMRERFVTSSDYFRDHHEQAREDIAFRNGDQWPENIRQMREMDGKPCLKSNRLNTFIQQVTNSQKANMPGIAVKPVDSKADPATAEVLQSVIKTIEAASNADLAYAKAFEEAATSGLGYFRLITDYASEDSMDQDIRIKPILNSFSVLLDPFASDTLYSDAEYGIVWEDIPKDNYKSLYPDSECMTDGFLYADDPDFNKWVAADSVRVAEYFYAEYEPFTLVQLADGKTLDKKDYEILVKRAEAQMQSAAMVGNIAGVMAADTLVPKLVAERESRRRTIHWCKTNGYEILEKTVWAGKMVPIIPVMGESYVVEGKRVFEGVVRHAKDPQRKINYFDTMETETVALAPRAPFIGVAGQFKNFENQWRQANIKNLPYLEYNLIDLNGQPAPPPTRQNAEPAVAAITQARMFAVEDMKATTGIFDPSLGNVTQQESGIAVLARQQQASVSNFHFGDNLAKSVRLCGQMIVEMLPKIYDVKRTLRINGDEEKVVEMGANIDHDPKNLKYRLGMGQYDVVVQADKANTTQRQQSLNVLSALISVAPELGAACGDLIVKNLDIPEAREISDRLKRAIPPSVLGEELPAEVQAQINQIQQEAQMQMQQMQAQGQQMQLLIAQLTAKSNELQVKVDSKQMEIESRERVEFSKLQTNLLIEGMKTDAAMTRELVGAGLGVITQRLQHLDMNQAPTPEPVGSPAGTETFVIPGVNDPVTAMRKTEEEAAARQQAEQQSMQMAQQQTPIAPPNLRPRGPSQIGARIERMDPGSQ